MRPRSAVAISGQRLRADFTPDGPAHITTLLCNTAGDSMSTLTEFYCRRVHNQLAEVKLALKLVLLLDATYL